MKTIIKNLRKQLEKLRELVQAREDKVDDMSEGWQESEKCEYYMDKTRDIEERANELDTLIDDLTELL